MEKLKDSGEAFNSFEEKYLKQYKYIKIVLMTALFLTILYDVFSLMSHQIMSTSSYTSMIIILVTIMILLFFVYYKENKFYSNIENIEINEDPIKLTDQYEIDHNGPFKWGSCEECPYFKNNLKHKEGHKYKGEHCVFADNECLT